MAKVDNEKYIYGKRQSYFIRIHIKEVVCFLVVRRRYTYVYYKNTFARALGSLSKVYESFNKRCFIKVSKKAIINTHYIESIKYNKPSHCEVLLTNGMIINVNRKYITSFKKKCKIKRRWN